MAETILQVVVLLFGVGGTATAVWKFMAKLVNDERQENARLNAARIDQAEKHAAEQTAMLHRYERIIDKQGDIIRAQKITLDTRENR